jgi:hypothetical protein
MKTFSQFMLEAMKDIRHVRDIPHKTFVVRGMSKGKSVSHVIDAAHEEHARAKFRAHYRKMGDHKAYVMGISTPSDLVDRKKVALERQPMVDAARKKTQDSMKANKKYHDDMQKRVDTPSKHGKHFKGD